MPIIFRQRQPPGQEVAGEPPDGPAVDGEPSPPDPDTPTVARRARLGRRSKLLVFVATVAMVAFGISAGAVESLRWMETPEFCGSCHTMKPELQAYEQSPHKAVDCAECHIGAGVMDFVQAKLNGTLQVLHLVTDTYPRPIPPAAHGMVKGAESCRKCHKDPPGKRDELVVRNHFDDDADNTELDVALVIKLADVGADRARGIHWHVRSKVEYLPIGEDGRDIAYVRVTSNTGEVSEFVSPDLLKLSESSDVLTEVRVSDHLRQMDCLVCHNRAGHEFLSPDRALDDAIGVGEIDKSIPFIKRRGLELLNTRYTSTEEALTSIAELPEFYRNAYPETFAAKPRQIYEARDVIQHLFGLVASPEMQASYANYPSYLGHRESAGCFRCHDGAHVRVDAAGRPTNQAIAFSCSLCHSFPQKGSTVQAIPLGTPPASHRNRQWMVDHQRQAGSSNVAATTCVQCHSQNYCDNCHAARLIHGRMLFDHASAVRDQGIQSCRACHQKPFCSRCHQTDVLQGVMPPGAELPPPSAGPPARGP